MGTIDELIAALQALKLKQDHVDKLWAADVRTIVDGIFAAMDMGGSSDIDITTEQIEGGTRVIITDAEGTVHSFDVKDGDDAYEVYKSTVPSGQTPMSNADWLASLKGSDGQNGAPGHNPCLGRFSNASALSGLTAQAGDYAYVDDSTTTPGTTTTYVYHYVDSTNGWDSGTEIEVNDATFTTSQSVSGTAIKDLDGNNDTTAQGVLSAEESVNIAYSSKTKEKTKNLTAANADETHRLWLKSDNTFAAGDTDTDACIYRLAADVFVRIKANSSKNATVAFLAEDFSVVSGATASYAEGVTAGSSAISGRTSITAGNEILFHVSEDCKLYIYGYNSNSVNYFPQIADVITVVDTENKLVCKSFDFSEIGIVEGVSELTTADAFLTKGVWLNNSSVFRNGDTNHDAYLFRVSHGLVLRVKGSSTMTSQIAFINNTNPEDYDEAIYANDTTYKYLIRNGDSVEYQINEDCVLYVYGFSDATRDAFPNAIELVSPVPTFDFTIEDSDGNIVLGIKDGRIQTTGDTSHAGISMLNIPIESGYFFGSLSNAKDTHFSHKRSKKMIYTGRATHLADINSAISTVYEYDENGQLLQSSSLQTLYTLHSNCSFVKLDVKVSVNIDSICIGFVGATEQPKEIANIAFENNYDSFAISISQSESTSLRLMLPSTYTQCGQKVPLVIYISGDGGFEDWNTAMGNPDDLNDLVYLKNEGFAVAQVYPWGSFYATKYSGVGITSAFPLPICVRCYAKAIEYLTTRYNIDVENMFVIAKSGGGKMVAYFALTNNFPFKFKHIINMSPTLSLEYWGTSGAAYNGWRNMVLDEYQITDGVPQGFRDNASFFITYNSAEDKTVNTTVKQFILNNFWAWANFNPTFMGVVATKQQQVDALFANVNYYRLPDNFDEPTGGIYSHTDWVRIGNGTPIHFLHATDDTSCPYQASEEMSLQLQNGGQESKIIKLTGNHGAYDEYNTKTVTPTYSDTAVSVPYGWRYLAWLIKTRYFHETPTVEEFGDDLVETVS